MIMFKWQFILLIIIAILFIVYFLYNPVKTNTGKNTNINKEIADISSFQKKQKNIAFSQINTFRWSIIIAIIIFSLLSIYFVITPTQNYNENIENNDLILAENIKELEAYLLENPNDISSLKALGLFYFNLTEFEKSIAVFKKALQLSPDDISLLLQYASVIAYKNDNSFIGEPQVYIEKALEINPNYVDALYLRGFVALDNKNYIEANNYWQKALSLISKDSEARVIIENAIDELESYYIDEYSLSIDILIADDILAKRDKNDYLMVYAKEVDGASNMPIAIKKILLSEFNGNIILTDINSLTKKLSTSNQFIIVVRISSSGMALKQEDDFEFYSDIINAKNTRFINLIIE